METLEQGIVVPPLGEQPMVEARSALADTFAGRVHVEWDTTAPVTPFGRLPFFIDYVKQAGLFDAESRNVRGCSPARMRRRRETCLTPYCCRAGRPSSLRGHHRPALRSGEPTVA